MTKFITIYSYEKVYYDKNTYNYISVINMFKVFNKNEFSDYIRCLLKSIYKDYSILKLNIFEREYNRKEPF